MRINRREFIKISASAGAVALGAGPLFTGCSGVKRADLASPDQPYELAPSLDEHSAAILYYASLAPSSHNTQPWYVKVLNRDEWIIGADPKRRLPVVDPNNRELLLSIGAFVENLSLAARSLEYDAQTEVIASNPFDEDICRISLRKTKPGNYPLTRLTERRTIRNGFRNTELKNDDVRFLSGPLKEHFFYVPRESEHGQCIQEGAVEAFRAQTYRDDAQGELAGWIRFSNKEAGKHRDGLTPESMEIGGIAGWYVRTFMDHEDVMKENFRKRGIDGTAKMARQGGGWVIITSNGEKVSDLIETGRRFERMALMARERMIAVHPMTQMLEEETWRKEIASKHRPGLLPQFILRVGYLDSYPDPVSLRRPVSWFVRP